MQSKFIFNFLIRFVKVKKSHVMNIPENIDIIEAAAIPEAWLTGYQLCTIASVKKNDNVLIHAAASGVGTALIQLIKLYQAKSIALCSTKDKIEFCESPLHTGTNQH